MATNNTKNPLAPVDSQVDNQSIVGLPPVQARPATIGANNLNGGSISGGASPYTYNEKKGKGNNSEK